MKTYKTGDSVEYKIPVFVCTKCDAMYIHDPAMAFVKNLNDNNFVPNTIEKCSCGNDEFNYREASGIVGVVSSNLEFK